MGIRCFELQTRSITIFLSYVRIPKSFNTRIQDIGIKAASHLAQRASKDKHRSETGFGNTF